MTAQRSSWRPSLADAARLWRAAPVPHAVRRAMSGVISRGLDRTLASVPFSPAPQSAELAPGPIVVSGFHSEVLGLGTAARLTVAGLRRAGFAPVQHDIGFLRHTPLYENMDLPSGPGGVWIAHMNPPELNRLLFMLRSSNSLDRYRIGYWAWELDVLPPDWIPVSAALHEIWTPSRFVQAAVRKALPASRHDAIKVVPHAVEVAEVSTPPGVDFPEGTVTFLTMADFRSTSARKNPMGAVRAFTMAFPEPTPGVRLICKLVATDASCEDLGKLRSEAGGRADIIFIEQNMADAEVLGLIARCEVLLSLHRSEGYGLTLAEAMRFGRCVIATGWSGNMDFMDDRSAVLVPYALVPVSDGGPYSGWGGRWAEPDLDFAAQAIKTLARNAHRRASLGEAAEARVACHEGEFLEFLAVAPWRGLVRTGSNTRTDSLDV